MLNEERGISMRAGTIKNQVHLQQLEQKWQQKKNTLSENRKNEELTAEQRMLQDFQKQADEIREQNSTADIYNKLKSGGVLTQDEIAYLKENDPEALAKYEEATAQKKAYERELKNCRTKEDVEKVRLNRMGNFAAKAKAIANNPYIPKAKKVELMNELNNEVCMIRDAHTEFVRTSEYQDMPEDEQERIRKREDAASDGEMVDGSDQTGQDTEIPEQTGADMVASEIPEQTGEDTVGGTIPEELSFERVIGDMEQFVIRNSNNKPMFQTSV